ncbi:MAG: HD domain-containing protein [Cryobacterium sp.]|nr:HD domain-containing protein [Oligoflexia bacterium]
MEIRDVLHGSVSIESHEREVLDSRYFQRLRQIKQLGFAEFSYPSATHNRYVHSLGAMKVASLAFETIFRGGPEKPTVEAPSDRIALLTEEPRAFRRFRAVVRLAALLHDVGHGPLSHTSEFAMPPLADLKLPEWTGLTKEDRQATHEDYTLKIILDSGLTPLLEKAGAEFGFSPRHIACLIETKLPTNDDFFFETLPSLGGKRIDFLPILQQIISSELDADRMDYLRRDSLFAGVSYGEFDFDWLVSNLTSHVHGGRCYLTLQHRALYAFEDFLISRYHMFLMVYFHYKSIVFDSMLGKYLETAPSEYVLPSDIEAYCEANDGQLYARLARSENEWAKRISEKRPYRMLIELHSGIPAGKAATASQEKLLTSLKGKLDAKKIHYLEASVSGELSKYFRKPGDPIFIRYDNHFSDPNYIALEKCTDLFEKYQEKRSITRLYVAPEVYAECVALGRGTDMLV